MSAVFIITALGAGLSAASVAEVPDPQQKPAPERTSSDVELNGEYFKGYISDTWSIITAPGRWDRKDWLKATAVAGTTAVLYIYDGDIKKWVQNNRNDSSDTIAKYAKPFGDAKYTAPPLALIYAYGHFYESDKARRVGLLGIESLIVANLFTQALKNLGHRHRPYTDDPPDTWDGPTLAAPQSHASFPSGHATAAFSVLTVVATEYGDVPAVAPLAYGLATLTALARVNTNNHWASDVFFGSAIGYFSAKAIIRYNSAASSTKLTISPVMDGEYAGLVLSCRF